MAKDKELIRIMQIVSKDMNIPYDVVELVYESMFKFIKTEIEKLPLKLNLTKEEFDKLRVSFNIPSIGKLYTTYDRYLTAKQLLEYTLEMKNKK